MPNDDEIITEHQVKDELRAARRAAEIYESLYRQEQERVHELYRRVFPAEAPWADIETSPGVTHSPYVYDKLLKGIDRLVAGANDEIVIAGPVG